MIICKAAFEELVPGVFAIELRNAPKAWVHQSNAECSVQWEDDGGRLDTKPAPSAMGRQLSARVAANWLTAPRNVVIATVTSGSGLSPRD